MKQKILRTFILMAGITLFAACSDDDNAVETGHAQSCSEEINIMIIN
jgi:hypothetical protein